MFELNTFLKTIEEEKTWIQRRREEQEGGQRTKDELSSNMSDFCQCRCGRWEAVTLPWCHLLTWLCMNLRLIPSSVTCRSPPSPVFMSWTGNSPPSSGPAGNKNQQKVFINVENDYSKMKWQWSTKRQKEMKPQIFLFIPGLMLCCLAAAFSILSFTQ